VHGGPPAREAQRHDQPGPQRRGAGRRRLHRHHRLARVPQRRGGRPAHGARRHAPHAHLDRVQPPGAAQLHARRHAHGARPHRQPRLPLRRRPLHLPQPGPRRHNDRRAAGHGGRAPRQHGLHHQPHALPAPALAPPRHLPGAGAQPPGAGGRPAGSGAAVPGLLPPPGGGDHAAGDRPPRRAERQRPERRRHQRGRPRQGGLRAGGRHGARAHHAWEGRPRPWPHRPADRGQAALLHVRAQRSGPNGHRRAPPRRHGHRQRPCGSHRRHDGRRRRLGGKRPRGGRGQRRVSDGAGGTPGQPGRHQPGSHSCPDADVSEDEQRRCGGALHHPGHPLCAGLRAPRLHPAAHAGPGAHHVGLHPPHRGVGGAAAAAAHPRTAHQHHGAVRGGGL